MTGRLAREMRWAAHVRIALALGIGIGCGPAIPSTELPPVEPTMPANLIDPTTYDKRTAGLRATLARSGITFDDEPVIRYCGDHHGAERCMRCDVARREDTSNIDPDMIDGVAIAFAAYPPRMLEAAQLRHVGLCRMLRYEDAAPDDDVGGAALISDHRVVVSIAPFVGKSHRYDDEYTIGQIVHHEVFHLFDHATLGEGASDPAWTALNPPSFAYREPKADEVDRPDGFVNRYATTNEREDRATLFEFLMGQPNKLCEIAKSDPIVKTKTVAVWKRVAKVMGDDLLRQHAPCVDWIGAKRTPAKKMPAIRRRSSR